MHTTHASTRTGVCTTLYSTVHTPLKLSASYLKSQLTLDVRHRRAAASRSNAVSHSAEAGRTRTSRHPLGRLQPQVAHQCYQAPIGLYRVPACSCTAGRQGPKGRNDCLQALALQASVTCDYSCSRSPKSSTVWPKRPPAEPLLQVSVTRCSLETRAVAHRLFGRNDHLRNPACRCP